MEARVAQLVTDELLAEAADRFGVTRTDLTLLGSFENYVYSFERRGEPAVLRLTHDSHRSAEQVAAELDWVTYLHERGARVAGVRPSERGGPLERIAVADGEFIVTSFHRAPGGPVSRENLAATWHDSLFREWGRTTGLLHTLTREYRPAPGRPRRITWHEDDLLMGHHLPRTAAELGRRFTRLIEEARSLPHDDASYGLIHTDLHPGNFFVHEGRLTVFDFDDSAYHHFASDIAIALYYALWMPRSAETREEFARRFLALYLEGYREENPELDERTLEQLPLFLALRDLTLYAVLHKKWDMANLGERQRAMVEELGGRLERGEPPVALDFD